MKLLQQLDHETNVLLKSCRAFLTSVRRDGPLAAVRAVLPRLFQFKREVLLEKDLTESLPEPVSLPGITIRHATTEDIPLFLESLSHCQTEYDLAVVTQDIAAGRTYYIASEDGRIVHYTRILKPSDGVSQVLLADGEGEVGPAFTVPEARRRRIHVNVEHQMWRELAEAGYRKLVALIGADNTASLRAVEKMMGVRRGGTATTVRLFGMTVFRKVQRN